MSAPQASGTLTDHWHACDPLWRQAIEPHLLTGEQVIAWMLADVDPHQNYRDTLVVLTTHRLLCLGKGDPTPQSWPLNEITRIKTKDQSGLGTLEVLGEHQRLAWWHYTITHGPAALVLADRLEELKAGRPVRTRTEEDDAPEAEEQAAPPNTLALFRLWDFAKPYAGWMFLALLVSIAAAKAGLVPLQLIRPMTDDVLIPVEKDRVASTDPAAAGPGDAATTPEERQQKLAYTGAKYVMLMLLAATAAWLLGWAQGAILSWVSERVTGSLRARTYAHLQKLSLEYFGGKRTGDLMTRISTDSDRLCQFLADSVVDFAADCVMLSMIALDLYVLNKQLALVTLAPFPFILWLMYFSRDKLQLGFQGSGRAWSRLTSVLADTIPGIRVVKAFAQEHREIDRFNAANQQLILANNRVNSIWTFFWPLIGFLNNLGVIIVWAYGVMLFLNGQITTGALTTFVFYAGKFYGRLESMSRMVNASQRAAASAQRIFEVLDHVSTVPQPAKPVPLDKLRGDLEFRQVGFRYGNRKVIRDFSLKIEAGEMIGLVGHTGAGKSTLINLVCRFFDVAEGAILADGVDIRSYNIEKYRGNVGIVLQDPFLFFGSIADNISYGRPDATREEIIQAAKAARAHEFILQLPDGYDSLVGERGQSLSGGERQRISIARALLIDPRILILDEATSALDSTTERQIQEALQNLVQGRTTIAIAHRLSTLRQANRIIVIDRGRLVEVGTHEELLAIGGTYAALHEAQKALTKDIGW